MDYATFLSYHPNKYLLRLYEIQWELNKLGLLQLAGDYAYLISYIISEQWNNPLNDSRFLKAHPRGENTYCPPTNNCPIPFTRSHKNIVYDLWKHTNKDNTILYLKEVYDLLSEYRGTDPDVLFTDTIDAYIDYTKNILECAGESIEPDPWPEPGDYPDLETFNPNVPFCIENVGDTPVEIGIYNRSTSNHASRSDCKVSYNLKTWQDYNLTTLSSYTSDVSNQITKLALSNKGDRVYIKADNYAYKPSYGAPNHTHIVVLNQSDNTKIRARGNIASLNHGNNDLYKKQYLSLNKDESRCFYGLFQYCASLIQAPDLPYTSLADGCYYYMFYGCTKLVKVSELLADTLVDSCYYSMFYGCTSLEYCDILPATKLAGNCYNSMFSGCTNLVTPPELPATELADSCYRNMFSGCTNLKTIPELPSTQMADSCYATMFNNCSSITSTVGFIPATELANGCYQGMFNNCVNLIDIPKVIPATQLKPHCYNSMFNGCSKLDTPPELPATDMVNGCYKSMFSNCIAMKFAPKLQAKTLASECYHGMFNGCKSLLEAPYLPATILSPNCYNGMFSNCTSLVQTPDLSATDLADSCYANMFYGCSSLVQVPELPAIVLKPSCYYYMFYGCKNLNVIKTFATDISAKNCVTNWLYDVAKKGEFFCVSTTQWSSSPTGSGIPFGWDRYNIDEPDYIFQPLDKNEIPLCLVNTGDIAARVRVIKTGNPEINDFEISYDNQTWEQYEITTDSQYIDLNNYGDKVFFRGNVSSKDHDNYIQFITHYGYGVFDENIKIKAYGNVNSILIKDTYSYFYDIREKSYCFYKLFSNCKFLVKAPLLIATKLANNCYESMFSACHKLSMLPKLQALELADYCYAFMFNDCQMITETIELPATAMKECCYQMTFGYCSSLLKVNRISAKTLAVACFHSMFYKCKSLKAVTDFEFSTTATNCCYTMFNECISLERAPLLPAAEMAATCYYGMFNGCSKLNYIKCLATSTSGTDCMQDWLKDVSATGDFYCIKESVWDIGKDGIPVGWIRHDIE